MQVVENASDAQLSQRLSHNMGLLGNCDILDIVKYGHTTMSQKFCPQGIDHKRLVQTICNSHLKGEGIPLDWAGTF